MEESKIIETIQQLKKINAELIRARGAIASIAGEDFVGYIHQEADGLSVEVWSWGVNHGKVFRGKTIDELYEKCITCYDAPLNLNKLNAEQ